MNEKTVTRNIEVEVESFYQADQSEPEASHFLFSYRIRIRNIGESTVQLLSRHWIIIDGHGRVEEVKGPGVVGQQPRIQPGTSFEYESFCPLNTPTGSMRGTYQMVDEIGMQFDAEIPKFFLVEPSYYH